MYSQNSRFYITLPKPSLNPYFFPRNLYSKREMFIPGISEERNAWPVLPYDFAREGFSAGYLGYQNSENQHQKDFFQSSCEDFAKKAEKLFKYFRRDGVISSNQNLWQRRQNVKKYMLEKKMS